MRNMLTRAAEIRESEQQQIFDALDEIHARLSPLESIGSVRKRLSEMPDRTEVSVLAERLDEAMSKLEAQDTAIAAIGRAVESIVDKLATPFAQLDGRLDGVAGRFEGVAGRMDGLEDKLSSIHRRIDELDSHLDKQDGKIDLVPGSVHGPVRERIEIMETALRGRLDEVDEGVHEHLDGTKDALARVVGETTDAVQGKVAAVHGAVSDSTNALHGRFTETSDSLHGKLDTVASAIAATRDALGSSVGESREAVHAKLDEATDALRDALRETKETVDASDRLEFLAERLEKVTARLDEMATRLDTVEDGFTAKLGDLGAAVERGLSKVEGTLSNRPDSESVETLVRRGNDESVRRIGGHLDEAMATFAELMLGGGQPTPPPPTTLPRQGNRRRTNGKGPKSADKVRDDNPEDNDIAAGA
ncbi:apolipoprotein A1/A4/E family protein [Actinokineospora iranica]|nr:apolipoprotein A1/A4/E family protein [Actinokineospora iranica]